MNILCIGDVVGRLGAEMVKSQLPYLKQDYNIQFVVANGENATTGNGINQQRLELLLDAGVDVVTMGNHTFSKKAILELFQQNYPIIRPANYPQGTPGNGWIVRTCQGRKIAVINLIGRTFMNPVDCPFQQMEHILQELEADIILVDFHAEATSEKAAMAWYLDGKVQLVFGTHTHVQTADEQILPAGTAFITDIGMTGPYHSILGVDKDIAIYRFTHVVPKRYELADSLPQLCGIVLEIDDDTHRAKGIKRLQIR
mgnify:CR=1 FL=1